MRVVILRSGGEAAYTFVGAARPTALEVLLQARSRAMPDLAFRYGCRDAACGLCAVTIDGRPRLACRDRVRDGSRVGPPPGLPVLRDLVVDRASVSAKLRGRLPPSAPSAASPTAAYRSLGRCIDCYACLDGCPLHAAGRGDPVTFLKLQRVREDPGAGGGALAAALELGLADCADCRGCRCAVGIPLVKEVIDPLLAGVAGRPSWRSG